MKKNLVVIILSAVIFVLLLGITTYVLLKDDWKGRLEGLLVEYNKVLVSNEKMTEELALLKQEQQTPGEIEKSAAIKEVASSSVSLFSPNLEILNVIKSPEEESVLMLAQEKGDGVMTFGETYCGEGLDFNGGQCHFLVVSKKRISTFSGDNNVEIEPYLVRDFVLWEITHHDYLDFSSVKFVDERTVEFSAHTPGDGDGSNSKISFDIFSGNAKILEQTDCYGPDGCWTCRKFDNKGVCAE